MTNDHALIPIIESTKERGAVVLRTVRRTSGLKTGPKFLLRSPVSASSNLNRQQIFLQDHQY